MIEFLDSRVTFPFFPFFFFLLPFLALVCPVGWNEFEGSCYKVLEKFGYLRKFSWSTALDVCSGYGGGLASISNEKEMDFVRNLSSKFRSDPVWIGLAYRFQKRAYLWSNGSSFNSSVSGKWLGELARNVSENKCVEILGNGSSLTDCCKENKYFICKKAKGELPQKKFMTAMLVEHSTSI